MQISCCVYSEYLSIGRGSPKQILFIEMTGMRARPMGEIVTFTNYVSI